MYGWKKYKDYEKCIGTKDGTHKIGRVNTAAVEMTYLNWNEFEIIPIFYGTYLWQSVFSTNVGCGILLREG